MTSILEEKYKESMAAAELLKNIHYSSAVNRSYYGCFQFLLDTLHRRMKITAEDFYSQRIQNKEGTHGWASKLIAIELAHMNREDFKWFQRTFPQFQKLREKADYSQEKITQTEAMGSISTAASIINVVNKQIKQK